MLLTIEGVYRNDKIELDKTPDDIEQADVIVTLLNAKQKKTKSQMISRGMFAGEVKTSAEDFRLAEWRGEKELADIAD